MTKSSNFDAEHNEIWAKSVQWGHVLLFCKKAIWPMTILLGLIYGYTTNYIDKRIAESQLAAEQKYRAYFERYYNPTTCPLYPIEKTSEDK